MSEIEAINEKILAIFAEHGVEVAPGDEGFRLGVEQVRAKGATMSASRLEKLGEEWDHAWRESETYP